MYTDKDEWLTIRRRVLVEGVSKRQILRETGMHWRTLEKILTHSRPPGRRRSQLARSGDHALAPVAACRTDAMIHLARSRYPGMIRLATQ